MRKACGVEVLLFEIARCLWIRSSFYSNFEKQNRKGSPQSLIYPLKGKLTSFVIKQFFHFEKGTSDSYEIPPAAVLLHPSSRCDDYFRKTSTCAEMTAIRSHRGYNPRVLRMTKSADGRIPSIIAYRRRQKQQAVFVGFCSIPRGQPAGLVCSEMTS